MTVLHAINDEQGNAYPTAEQKRIAELEAMVAKLKASQRGKLTLKVSQAGAVSVYGMGKWPVTLYKSQWERLLEASDQIKAFIGANADTLASKD